MWLPLAPTAAHLLLVGASGLVPQADSPPAAADALAEGDAHYARRAEGASGPVAKPAEIDAALAAYRRALAVAPDSPEVRGRLLRARFFQADFCGAAEEEKKRLFEEARRVGEEGVERLERRTRGPRGEPLIQALRAIPGAASLYFWTAVSWGEWALLKGKLASARQGAGGRIRDLGQTVVDLDPDLEQGGGYRILGRLHDQSPRVPFFTFWVSRRKAVEYLREALERGPENTVNQFFLAEALLNHEPARKEEARQLLLRCARSLPRPEYRVEDAYYAELSRQRLGEIR